MGKKKSAGEKLYPLPNSIYYRKITNKNKSYNRAYKPGEEISVGDEVDMSTVLLQGHSERPVHIIQDTPDDDTSDDDASDADDADVDDVDVSVGASLLEDF